MKQSMVIAALLGLLLPLAAPAQEEAGPLTWFAFSKVKPGKTEDAVKLSMKYDKEIFDGLMAEGVVAGWGMATPINHRPGDDANLVMWVSLADWSKVDQWVAEVMEGMMSQSAEQKAAMMEESQAVYEERSHYDWVARHVHFDPGAEGAAAPRYFYVGAHMAKPGKAAAVTQLYKDFVVPVAEGLQGDGALVNYGLYVQEVHGEPGWTHQAWYGIPDLAAIGKLGSAIDAAMTPEILQRVEESLETDGHSDRIWMVLHYGSAPQ